MPTALITGITGQDGSYLCELLLTQGYVVHGIIRRSSSFNTARIDHLYQDMHESHVRMHLHFGDLGDGTSLRRIVSQVMPDDPSAERTAFRQRVIALTKYAHQKG